MEPLDCSPTLTLCACEEPRRLKGLEECARSMRRRGCWEGEAGPLGTRSRAVQVVGSTFQPPGVVATPFLPRPLGPMVC
jgi:hypothetical protein